MSETNHGHEDLDEQTPSKIDPVEAAPLEEGPRTATPPAGSPQMEAAAGDSYGGEAAQEPPSPSAASPSSPAGARAVAPALPPTPTQEIPRSARQPSAAARRPSSRVTPERFIVRKPWRAGALALLPGVGYLYLGLYQRAVVFFGAFILGISIAAELNTPFLAFALMFLYVFGVLDTYRQAVLLNAGFQPDLGMSWVPFSLGAGQGRRLLGGVLVAGGGLELLSRVGLWQWRWLFDYGFVLAILVGAWLLVSASRRYPSHELAEDAGY